MGRMPGRLFLESRFLWFEHIKATAPCKPDPRIPLVSNLDLTDSLNDSREAYYVFIHSVFPILPPPDSIPVDHVSPRHQDHVESFEEGFESSSPVGLAISAILALIPCPDDTDHLSHESLLFRRKYAQYLAQSALESIEAESEIPDSSTEPPRALEDPPDGPVREPFHRGVPLELESIIALDLLSVYEYAQRGNLKKMQSRAGQALMSAMALSIHSSSGDDEFCEARRRVWWMTVSLAPSRPLPACAVASS